MAVETGTATDFDDIWSKFITFITTNSDLVADSQAWTAVWTAGGGSEDGVVLSGPGLSGGDQVLIGLQLVKRPTPDEYEIQMVGMTGVIDTATTILGHVNVTPYVVRMFVDSSSMDYWFVANGRRFVVVAKMSTVFEAMYGGLMLPYALPDQYSYPLFVGGSAGYTDQTGLTSWRSTSDYHRHFPHSYYDAPAFQIHQGSAFLLSPDGEWLNCAATGDQAQIGIAPRRFFTTDFDIVENQTNGSMGYLDIRKRMRSGFDDSYMLTPLTLVQATPSDQTFGILDGAYHVSGFSNSSENVVTIGGVDHLVVQDVFRTDLGEFWALKLE